MKYCNDVNKVVMKGGRYISILLFTFLIYITCSAQEVDSFINSKQYYDAIDLLDKQLRKDKKNTALLIKRAEVFYLLKDYRNGMADYDEAIKYGADSIVYIERAYVGASKTRDKKQMLKYLDLMSDNDSLYLKYGAGKIELLLNSEKVEQAYDEALKYLKIDSTNKSVNYLASKCALRLRKTSEALKYIERSLDGSRGNVDYFIQRAEVYGIMEEYSKATLDISMALDLNPRNAEAYYQRAMLKVYMEDNQGACFDFQNALQYKHPLAADKVYEYCGDE